MLAYDMSMQRNPKGDDVNDNEQREVVQVGWDGVSRPMYRYRDEMHLPDYARSVVPASAIEGACVSDDELAEERAALTDDERAELDALPTATTPRVDRGDLLAAAEKIETFAGIDEGEYEDYDALLALAARLRAAANTTTTTEV